MKMFYNPNSSSSIINCTLHRRLQILIWAQGTSWCRGKEKKKKKDPVRCTILDLSLLHLCLLIVSLNSLLKLVPGQNLSFTCLILIMLFLYYLAIQSYHFSDSNMKPSLKKKSVLLSSWDSVPALYSSSVNRLFPGFCLLKPSLNKLVKDPRICRTKFLHF